MTRFTYKNFMLGESKSIKIAHKKCIVFLQFGGKHHKI